MKIFAGFISILLLMSFHSFAQFVVLSGKVVDQTGNKPIENVEVHDAKDKSGVVTDIDGHFSIRINRNENLLLVFSHVGFKTVERDFTTSETRTGITVIMQAISEQLQEVEIMGISVTDKPYRTEHVDITMLEQSNLQDVGAFLRGIPNVNGIRKGAMGIDPVIRGFKYSQLNVQVNGGTRIEGGCPNRMDPATAHVDLSDLKDINIIKGPFALKYGVNFGGMIDLTTYRPVFYNQYETHVSALIGGQTNHTGFKTKVGVNGGNRFVTYNVTGSWKKYGDYKAGNDEVVPASLENQTFSAMLGFKLAEKHTIYADADISKGLDVDFPALPMDERIDDTKLFSLNYMATDLGKSINFVRFKAYLSDVKHEMDNKNRPFSDTVVAVSTIHARNMGGKFGVNFNIGKAKMEVGADYENIFKDGTRQKYLIMQPMLPTKEEDLWNNAGIQNIGVFAEYQSNAQKINWIVSARLDINDANSDPLTRKAMNGDVVYQNEDTKSQYTNFSISGGVTWHVADHSDLMIALGRGTRSPDMTERFIILLPVGYDQYDYLGNPQLKPEVNNELDLGYRFNHQKFGNIELSGFYSYVTNYISTEVVPPSEVKPQTKGVLGVKRFINIEKASLTGFEFSYITPSGYLWSAGLSAAYTTGWNPEAIKYVYDNGQVVDEEVIKNDPLPEIPPFEMNLKFSYKFFKQKLVPTLRLRYAAAQNRISESYGEKTTPGFMTLGLDVKYEFNQILTVHAGVSNLTNAAYYEHLNRRIIGSNAPLYEVGRVFYANLIFKL